MKYYGLENTSPTDAEVYYPVSAPSGLIVATVSSGLRDLLVLKTTESSFEGFFTDEFRTLPGKFIKTLPLDRSTLPTTKLPLYRYLRPNLLNLSRLLLQDFTPPNFPQRRNSHFPRHRFRQNLPISRNDDSRDIRHSQLSKCPGYFVHHG